MLIFSDDADDWVVVSDHSQEDHSQPGNLITSLDIPMRAYTRYVMVAKTDDNFLHLAEVQVMGH